MGIIWAIIIGFIVGIIAKVITGGSREPRGFILTTVLGIVGGVVGTWLGQAVGWSGEVYYTGILSPGEILYIPPFWLHEVETLTDGNISIPMRFSTTQSVASDLHQLSQNGLLREVTNAPLRDIGAIVDVLSRNRRAFLAREEAFVQALGPARGVEIELGSLPAEGAR